MPFLSALTNPKQPALLFGLALATIGWLFAMFYCTTQLLTWAHKRWPQTKTTTTTKSDMFVLTPHCALLLCVVASLFWIIIALAYLCARCFSRRPLPSSLPRNRKAAGRYDEADDGMARIGDDDGGIGTAGGRGGRKIRRAGTGTGTGAGMVRKEGAV
ncbi:hypothetical protein B0T17DRAFT_613769 [Bombardia bombarda]|uniref:Uncharacterized protein n=1 Tax=Bombardia bombarda TaxID=252184 RepID=A0AA39XP40_9PEZI|nr:hypothetical protein B0T17DRAFT_613769 [Bombardia bombarda]